MDGVSVAAIVAGGSGIVGVVLGYLTKKSESKQKADVDLNTLLTNQIESHRQRIQALETKLDAMQSNHEAEMRRMCEKYEAELKVVHQQKHDAQNVSQLYLLKVVHLQNEVNSLLHESGKPSKYSNQILERDVDVTQPVPGTST